MTRHVRPSTAWGRQRLAGPQPLTPTGNDCDCGCPMVWVGRERTCAVYGSHPPVEHPELSAWSQRAEERRLRHNERAKRYRRRVA